MTQLGPGEYVVRVGDALVTVDHWDKIPETFDHLIKWIPTIPDGPHTNEQHEQIENLPERLKQTLSKEQHAGRNKNR